MSMKKSRKLMKKIAKQGIEELYQRNGVGCCLHIVTDDGNIESDHVAFCIKYAIKQGCDKCLALGMTLLYLTIEQRAEVLGLEQCLDCGEWNDVGGGCYCEFDE